MIIGFIVDCDFPGCNALEGGTHTVMVDTIGSLTKDLLAHGFFVNGTQCYCPAHAPRSDSHYLKVYSGQLAQNFFMVLHEYDAETRPKPIGVTTKDGSDWEMEQYYIHYDEPSNSYHITDDFNPPILVSDIVKVVFTATTSSASDAILHEIQTHHIKHPKDHDEMEITWLPIEAIDKRMGQL